MPPSHLGQNLCVWRAAKQQQAIRSTHLVPSLRGIHVDVPVQVMPVPALENLPGEGGGKSCQSWVQEPPKCAVPQSQPRVGLGTWGGGDPTAFSSESSHLGRRSQLLTWGKGQVGVSPTAALGCSPLAWHSPRRSTPSPAGRPAPGHSSWLLSLGTPKNIEGSLSS